MRKSLILFWNGLTGILVGIAEWFTVVLGMKDESKYGRFVRRVVGGCFAFMMLMMAIAAGWGCWQGICDYFGIKTSAYSQDEYYEESPFNIQYLSRNAKYYSHDIVIKPRYRHAWIFSEGLAAVDDNGWIKFIDCTGKVVIDLK